MFAECKTCKWRSDNFTSACVNGESEHRADFVSENDSCDKWEKKTMNKRERVMNGLDCCINHGKETPRLGTFVCDFKNCSYEYYAGTPCYRILMKEALELLKAQEPKFVPDIAEAIIGCKPKVKVGHCPSCDTLIHETDNFCRKCGQAVKWNE